MSTDQSYEYAGRYYDGAYGVVKTRGPDHQAARGGVKYGPAAPPGE